MEAVLWRDPLCPWCWIGRARTGLLEARGITVTVLPFELHPNLPADGVPTPGRYRRLAEVAEAEGRGFRVPSRLTSTRRALAVAEWVRRRQPDAFAAVDDGLYAAQFLEDRRLDDPAVLRSILTEAGVDATGALVDADEHGDEWLAEARAAAYDVGATGTPSWWVDDRLLIPGLQTVEWFERILDRLQDPRRTAGL